MSTPTVPPPASLVCPKCKGPLQVREAELVCMGCSLAYPVRRGIPLMLVKEASPLEGTK